MKKILSVILAALLLLALSVPVLAEDGYNFDYCRVSDEKGILTDDDIEELDADIIFKAKSLEMDFAVLISGEKDDETAFAASYVENNLYGYGADGSCVFLLIDYDNMVFDVYYYGRAKNFSASAKAAVSDAIKNSYNGGNGMRGAIEAFLAAAYSEAGKPSNGTGETVTATPWWYPEDPANFVDFHGVNLPHVVDDAGLLTASEKADLESKISSMIAKYGYDIVIYTTPTVYGYSNMMVCAADFYVYQGYGVGDDFSGLVFFHSVETGNRGWRTVCFGKAMRLFTESRINAIDDALYDLFVAGDHYEAYSLFLEKAAYVLEDKDPPEPFDYSTLVIAIIVGLVIGLVIAGMRISAMKKKMVLPKATAAGNYIVPGATVVRNITTTYLYTNVVRHEKPKSSSSGGGSSFGGGSSSSGRSFSGGGRNY